MPLSRVVDNALDLSVLGGYGRPGLQLRRALPDWPADPERMDRRVVIVTGASGGIGLAAAQGFADLGAAVHLVGRDEGRTSKAAATVGGTPHVCDISSLASLRAFTDSWSGPLDVLVNNAGVLLEERQLSADGIELTFATNVLGGFVLTRDLPLVAGSRVINVSSGGMYGQRLGADHFQRDAGVKGYARSKRAEVVLTELWAARLQPQGVVVHAMHPGWAATPGITSALPSFGKLVKPILRSAEQGADTIVWLGGSLEAGRSSGQFWHDRRPRTTHLYGLNKETDEARTALWDLCEALATR